MNVMRPIRILVVEDNAVNRLVVKAMLENIKQFDVTLVVAEDGQQAVDFITQGGTPDVVLMDVQMPVLDGWQPPSRYAAGKWRRASRTCPSLR